MPRKVDRYRADNHQTPAVCADLERLKTRRCGFCCGGNDHAVRSPAIGERANLRRRLRCNSELGPELSHQRDALRLQIDPDDRASLQTRQLRDELPDDAETDDGDGFAKTDVRGPHGMERNAAQRREARMLERDAIRDRHHQIAPGEHRLAVTGTLAAKGDRLSDLDVGDAGVHLGHLARARIAEHGVFAELGFDFREGTNRSGRPNGGGNLLKM